MRNLVSSKITWAIVAVGVVALAVGLWLFEPWRAFTRSTLDEPLPAVSRGVDRTAEPAGQNAEPTGQNTEPRELGTGTFVSQEHETTGTARVIELADGSRLLRLEGFATSDGPDVHVWLTDTMAGAEDGAYDDGRTVPLGELKATDGNQNYVIPPGTNLDGLRSAVIWCDRFNVAFGSAALTP